MAYWGKLTTQETSPWAPAVPDPPAPGGVKKMTIYAHGLGSFALKSHHKALPLSVIQMDGEMG